MKKINIEELIKERFDKPAEVGKKSIDDETIKRAVEKGEREFAVVLYPELLKHVETDCKFPMLKNFYVTGIFDLCRPGPQVLVFGGLYRYSLVTFSASKPKEIKICEAPKYLEDVKLEKNQRVEKYKEYYKDLEAYVNEGTVSDSLRTLTNKIPYEQYCEEVFDARCYSERYLEALRRKKKQKYVVLKELVEIIDPSIKSDYEKITRYIHLDSYEKFYPLEENNLRTGRGFFPLEKGDILISKKGAAYLFMEDSKTVISPGGCAVLRLKSTLVTPEYLYLYLNSDYLKDINHLSEILLFTPFAWRPKWSELGKIPVMVPKSDVPMALDKNATQKYIDIFNRKYRPYLVAEKELDVVLDEVVPEEMKGDSLVSNSDANERIIELMREVHKAISCKIYNGAVILMGAILEAFFTDWWGNIKGADYFRDPVCYEFVHGKEQPIDLTFRDAIDKVLKRLKITKRNKDIREKIEKIRAMRDDIHTRVYLKHGNKMTKSICDSALNDLEEIIRLRYRNFQMDSFMKTIAVE